MGGVDHPLPCDLMEKVDQNLVRYERFFFKNAEAEANEYTTYSLSRGMLRHTALLLAPSVAASSPTPQVLRPHKDAHKDGARRSHGNGGPESCAVRALFF